MASTHKVTAGSFDHLRDRKEERVAFIQGVDRPRARFQNVSDIVYDLLEHSRQLEFDEEPQYDRFIDAFDSLSLPASTGIGDLLVTATAVLAVAHGAMGLEAGGDSFE